SVGGRCGSCYRIRGFSLMNDSNVACGIPAASRLTVASLTVAELCGEYSFLVMPFILAAMMDLFRLSEATAGRLISLQLVGMTISSALISLTLRPGRSPRITVALAAGAVIVGNTTCALLDGSYLVGPARVLTGLGEGAAMAAATAAVCSMPNP